MSIALTVNGVVYNYPEVDDTDWGAEATDWAAAITNGTLQKAGGLFQLLAEVDFGTSYGVKSLYYKSRTANVADSGQIRLARADVINFRNEANSANLSLAVNSSNNLTFNGVEIVGTFTPNNTNSIDLDLTATVLTANLNLSVAAADAGFINAVNSIEADGLQTQVPIADTSTTGVLTASDWNNFNGKQAAGSYITALTGDVVAAGPGSSAATIQAGVIVDSMIAGAAAIAYSKLAALTASRALVSDGSGFVSAATTTATQVGYLSTTTSDVQTQIDSKLPTTVTTTGDMIYSSSGTTASRLAIGSTGQYLRVTSAAPAWTSFTSFTATTLTSGTGATYNLPTGCTAIWVRAVGPGAGGGGSAAPSNAGAGGGGGAGGYVEKFITNPSASFTYTIGTAGSASAAGNAAGGTPSGATTFADGGSISLSAGAGSAGGGSGGGSTGVVFTTGKASGGAASGGDVNRNGNFGDAGVVLSATQAMGGRGGDSPLGVGGEGGQGTSAGAGAGGYGSGGGGAGVVSGGSAQAGAAGAAGVIIIHEYYP